MEHTQDPTPVVSVGVISLFHGSHEVMDLVIHQLGDNAPNHYSEGNDPNETATEITLVVSGTSTLTCVEMC